MNQLEIAKKVFATSRRIAQKALAAHSVPMTMSLWNKLNRQRQQLSKEQLSGLRAIGVNQARTSQLLSGGLS